MHHLSRDACWLGHVLPQHSLYVLIKWVKMMINQDEAKSSVTHQEEAKGAKATAGASRVWEGI